MYFRFSAESVDIRRPHTQKMTPGLQCLRQDLHCHFGSVLTISEISMLPDSLIAFFDSALNSFERLFLVEIVLDSLFLWVTCDSPNQLKNVKCFGTFHHFFRNARDTEVNIRIVRCKVKLVHCITTFEMVVFLALCAVPPLFQVSLSCRDFGHVVLPSTQVSPVCRKNLVLLATHQQQTLELRASPNNLDWFWGIGLAWKNRNELFLQVTVERVSRLVEVQL